MASEIVRVAVVENEVEAELLDSILAERAIPHTLMSYRDTALDGLYQLQKGWGAVYAPRKWKAEILEIISDIRSAAPSEACELLCRSQVDDVPRSESRSQGETQDRLAETGDGIDDGEHAEHSEDQ